MIGPSFKNEEATVPTNIDEELDRLREYFEDRQDASCEPGEDRFHGNKEMSLLRDVETIASCFSQTHPSGWSYFRGALDALGVIYDWDGIGVAYHTIINTFDKGELVAIARRTGLMRWSGLSEYVRKQRLQEKWKNQRDSSRER